jgi:hypothetical protein
MLKTASASFPTANAGSPLAAQPLPTIVEFSSLLSAKERVANIEAFKSGEASSRAARQYLLEAWLLYCFIA